MVTVQNIARYAFAEPFRPFRLGLADGEWIEIPYSDMVAIGRSTITIILSLSDDAEMAKQPPREVALSSIVSIEPSLARAT